MISIKSIRRRIEGLSNASTPLHYGNFCAALRGMPQPVLAAPSAHVPAVLWLALGLQGPAHGGRGR